MQRSPSRCIIHRHTGGLEIVGDTGGLEIKIHRHTGGLEIPNFN